MRRFVLISAVVLVLAALLGAQRSGGKKNDDASAPRNLAGTIVDRAGQPVSGAVVYLENTRSLAVYTFITGNDGSYRFNNLSPDIDYAVHAESDGHTSPVKTLGSFNTHKQAHLNLKLGK